MILDGVYKRNMINFFVKYVEQVIFLLDYVLLVKSVFFVKFIDILLLFGIYLIIIWSNNKIKFYI